jgi:hypothetical protein
MSILGCQHSGINPAATNKTKPWVANFETPDYQL